MPAVVVNGRYLIALSMAAYVDGEKKKYVLFFKNVDLLIAQESRAKR